MTQPQKIITGIIIRIEKVKERDARITITTEDGLEMLYAAGIFAPTAKLKSIIQLFNRAQFTCIGTKITGATIMDNFTEISKQIHRFYLASAWADAVATLCKYSEDEEALEIYNHTGALYSMLAFTKTSAYPLFIFNFNRLLEFLGYGVDTETEIFETIMQIDETPPEELGDFKIGLASAKSALREISSAFIEHFDYKIPSINEFL